MHPTEEKANPATNTTQWGVWNREGSTGIRSAPVSIRTAPATRSRIFSHTESAPMLAELAIKVV